MKVTSHHLKWGPFPPNEVGRIAQHVRKDGHISECDLAENQTLDLLICSLSCYCVSLLMGWSQV